MPGGDSLERSGCGSLLSLATLLMTLRLLNWNLEWKRPRGPKGRLITEIIQAVEPDVAVLTEANGAYLDSGYEVTGEPDYGLGAQGDRRKVTMWSRQPWQNVDHGRRWTLSSGRFVAGRTQTPIGGVTVLGVCIPWHDAHVRQGRQDRARWEEHMTYLEGLRQLLNDGVDAPFVVVGDYNQRVPRNWQPKRVFEALEDALAGRAEIVTGGEVGGLGEQVIDHVAVSPELRASRVYGISRFHPEGGKLSDHHAVVVELERAAE